jgi:tetratricopeptide (TPR) repeat protein
MSLIAVAFVLAGGLLSQVDRDVLREQVRSPGIQIDWTFTNASAVGAIRQHKLDRLRALTNPAPHDLLDIASLTLQQTDEKTARPLFLKAADALKPLAKRSGAAASDLAIAYAYLGQQQEALATANALRTREPNSWRSWSTLGAVKALALSDNQFASLVAGNTGELMDRLRSDLTFRKRIDGFKAQVEEAKILLDKGVALAPSEPKAYEFREILRSSTLTVSLFERLFKVADGEASGADIAPESMFGMMLDHRDDARKVLLLTKDPLQAVDYVMTSLTVGLFQHGQTADLGMVPGVQDVPQLLKGSEHSEQRSYLDQALEKVATYPPQTRGVIRRDLAPAYLFLGKPEQAIVVAEKGAKDLPNSDEAARRHVDMLIVNERYAQAAEVGGRYLAAHPDWADVRIRTARALEREKRFAQALTVIRPRSEQNPSDLAALVSVNVLRLRLPDYALHLATIESDMAPIVQLKLGNVDVQNEAAFALAVVRGLQGQVDKARELLNGIDARNDPKLAVRIQAALKALGS